MTRLYDIPSHAFHNPRARDIITAWLSNQASPAEQAACSRFLAVLGPLATPRSVSAAAVHVRPPKRTCERQGSSTGTEGSQTQARAEPVRDASNEQLSYLRMRPSSSCSSSCRRRHDGAQPIVRRPQSATPLIAGLSRPREAQNEENTGMVMTSDWITLNQQMYGFRDMYPDLYNEAAHATRARPARNVTFASEYADSLKRGAGEYWKRFLRTTNQATNEAVYPCHLHGVRGAATHGERAWQAGKAENSVAGLRGEQLYYGKLLTPQAAQRIDHVLATGDAQSSQDIIVAARALFALLNPDSHLSTTHLAHGKQKSLTDPQFEAMQKQVTRLKTMGFPRSTREGANENSGVQPVHTGPPQTHALPRMAGGAVRLDPETFKSKVPLRWPQGNSVATTTYMASIGSSAQAALRASKQRMPRSQPVLVTAPYGRCNPVTDLTRFTRFPVPQACVQASAIPFTDPERNPPETAHRMAFQKRDPEEVAASLATAARQVQESREAKQPLDCGY